MLLESYTLEIFNSRCNPGAMGEQDCPSLGEDRKKKLHDYMARFFPDDYEIIPG